MDFSLRSYRCSHDVLKKLEMNNELSFPLTRVMACGLAAEPRASIDSVWRYSAARTGFYRQAVWLKIWSVAALLV